MKKRIINFLATLFLVTVSFHAVNSQNVHCDSIIKIINNDARSLSISGTLGNDNNEGMFKGFLELESQSGGTFDVESSTLKDACSGHLIPSQSVVLKTTPLAIEKGKRKELFVEITGNKGGNYEGNLTVSQKGGECKIIIPISYKLMRGGELSIFETDKQLTVKTVPPNILGALLPARINQKSISFRVENAGDCPVSPKNYTFSLIGNETRQAITDSQLVWTNPTFEVLPKGEQIVTFNLRRDIWDIPPDEYKGRLQLHMEQSSTPLNIDISLFSRMPIGLAVILLIVGIIAGRIVRDLTKREGQLNLLAKLLPLYNKISKIKIDDGREGLWELGKAIEARLENTDPKDANALKAIESEIDNLDKKITQFNQLEELNGSFLETVKMYEKELSKKLSPADKSEASASLRKIGEAILKGKEDMHQEGIMEMSQMMEKLENEMDSHGSKSLISSELFEGKMEGLRKLMEAMQQKADPESAVETTEESWAQWIARKFTAILGWLTGVKVNNRTRYAFFRPLVGLITLIVIVLMGFQEIYIEGEDTFGSNGVYDYLKLFLWGVVSDVLSRTLTGSEVKAFFENKPAQSNA